LLDVLQRHLAPASRPPVASQFQTPSESELQPLRGTFLKNRRRDIEVLAAALAAADWASIAALGHRMKGLAGSHGLADIGRIGATLEQAAGSHNRETIEREIEHLRHALAAVDSEAGRAA
jgi:HPt (histidine-containing phosphotransfer) domain-containing protein